MASALQVFASGAYTASQNSPDLDNETAQNLHLVINVTAIVTAPSVTFAIQGKDPLTGVYYPILTSAAVTAVGTTVLRVGPGLTVAANLSAADFIPNAWRVAATHANGNSITYSVSAVFGE